MKGFAPKLGHSHLSLLNFPLLAYPNIDIKSIDYRASVETCINMCNFMDCGDFALINNRLFLFVLSLRYGLFCFLFCLFFNPRNQRPYDPTTKLILHSFMRQICSISNLSEI